LPHDLSPWGMFQSADIFVQPVMVGLAIASLVTWTLWIAKTIELIIAKRRLRADVIALGSALSLTGATAHIGSQHGLTKRLMDAAFAELELSADLPEHGGIKERIASRLERIEAATARRVTRGTGVLATIGSTAPFVGLFGTVWGIMNSFIGISKSHTTNLAVV